MINKNIIFSLLLILSLYSCEEEPGPRPTLQLGAAPMITSPAGGTTFALLEADAENLLTTFEWTAADFGYQAAVTYTLQIDAAGSNFADPVTLLSANSLSSDNLSVGKLNNILLSKGLPFGFDNELEIRICASVSNDLEPLCSDAVAIKVNPYAAVIVYPKLTVPGDYQGWAPEDETYAVYSRKSDDIYEGYIYFEPDTAFYKYAQGLSWTVNWGDNELDGVLDPNGIDNNIYTDAGPGMYLLTCDLNTLMHARQITNWGVHGDATPGGWDTDMDMTWDDSRSVLTITTDLSTGAIKFRANDSDAINFGDDFTNGTLETDGAEIPITEAGNYTIDLLITVADYTYTLTKN